MSLPRRQIVHIRLEILDDAGLVGRGEVGPGVCELHGTDGGVVRLKDGLEVEGETVPEGEFTGGGAGEDASGFGGPLDGHRRSW